MIDLDGGWAQWDYQIRTFRAEINGQIYGLYTGEINTANNLAQIISLTAEQIADLEKEKTQAQLNY